MKKEKFLPFEEAREIARSLGLSSQNAWAVWAKTDRPSNIPSNPHNTYKECGWVSWGDWLGTGNVSKKQPREFLPFEEAREIVRGLGIIDCKAWKEWSKTDRPSNIPSNPYIEYKECGWVSWCDWLGTGNVANKDKQFLPFGEAREIVRGLGLGCQKDWKAWFKTNKPSNIPADPYKIYKDCGWVSWGDWLGTGRNTKPHKVVLPFGEAREIVRGLGLGCLKDWRAWFKANKPSNIPSNPQITYKGGGWVSWGDWLGTGNVSTKQPKKFLPFEEAREIVRGLGLGCQKDWYNLAKVNKPSNIPADPYTAYKGRGWVSWCDWLGNCNVSNKDKQFLPFEEARVFVRGLGLGCQKDWHNWAKVNRPSNIPSNPDKIYKGGGWVSWRDWLGTNNIARKKDNATKQPVQQCTKENETKKVDDNIHTTKTSTALGFGFALGVLSLLGVLVVAKKVKHAK